MIDTLRSLNVRAVFSTVVLALIGGWLAAFVFALFIVVLQYAQVQAAFTPDQVMVEFQTRIARELGRGLLLFLPQVGVVAGLLAWQILRLANGQRQPIIFGTVTGALLAMVEAIIMLLMAENWFYIVGLVLLLIGAGAFAGWLASPSEAP